MVYNSKAVKNKKMRYRIRALKMIKQWKIFFRNNFLVIFIIVLFLAAWFSKKQFPNLLKIDNTTVIIAVLSTMAGALAAILGILIAILMVAFELFRKTYVSYASREFFQNSTLKHLFTLFISTIIISIMSIMSIKHPLSLRNLNLFYFSIILFLFCMIILYPSFKAILTAANSKKKIEEIIDRINVTNINSLSTTAFRTSPSTYVSEVEKNPILILSEAAIQTIKDNDMLISKFIIFESTNRLLELLKDTSSTKRVKNRNIINSSKRDVINSFLIIFRHSARQACKQGDVSTLLMLLGAMGKIHTFCADNKIPAYVFEELDEMLEEMLEQTIKDDISEVAKKGLWLIEKILEKHLEKNVPAEKDIWSLHPFKEKKNIHTDPYKAIQWNHISINYVAMINRLIEKSIELGRVSLISRGLLTLERIASYVVRSNLGNLQKKSIIWFCYSYIESLVLECADKGLYNSNSVGLSLVFDQFRIDNALDKKAEFSKIPLTYFGDTLVQLARKNVLSLFTLNILGTVGRENVEKIEDNLHAEALLFVCKVFDQIRKILEKNNKVTENRRVYIEVFNQVSSLKQWMENKNKHNSIIKKKISTILKKFKNLDDYRKEFENKTVKWPALKHEENKDAIQGKNKQNGNL